MEDDLQEEIAELVADRVGITTVDRLEELVRLLQEVTRQGLVALLTVPRTPAGAAQSGHHLHEIEEPSAWSDDGTGPSGTCRIGSAWSVVTAMGSRRHLPARRCRGIGAPSRLHREGLGREQAVPRVHLDPELGTLLEPYPELLVGERLEQSILHLLERRDLLVREVDRVPPNCDWTGRETSPGSSAATAFANSGTNCVAGELPRSPPLWSAPGSIDSSRATAANCARVASRTRR